VGGIGHFVETNGDSAVQLGRRDGPLFVPGAMEPDRKVRAASSSCRPSELYDDRPRSCRDFTLGSAHCLTARRRVGLSL